MIGKVIVGVLLAALLVYGFIEARPLLTGPTLTIDSPTEGETVAGGTLTVSGHVARAVSFTLDGAPVPPDQQRAFSSPLSFPRGTSILTLTAADRFGRQLRLTRTICVPQNLWRLRNPRKKKCLSRSVRPCPIRARRRNR